ncbi:hypothetical protein A8M58_04845 [Yersinia pestis]|nr:hypothetical protein AU254_00480 [Yersinia pestis]PVU32028.1 hypothetical protein A8M58_04845 [Yersinia pestis]
MKSLTPQLLNGQQLHDQLQQVTQGIDQAIDWVKSTRQHAVRLDREAEHLTIKLRRMRNKAHPLSETALTAMTIGFVGQSQAGKNTLSRHWRPMNMADWKTRSGGKNSTFGNKLGRNIKQRAWLLALAIRQKVIKRTVMKAEQQMKPIRFSSPYSAK